MKWEWRIFLAILSPLACVAIATFWLHGAGFRLNLSSSIPWGIYRVSDTPIVRGDIVEYCPPNQAIFQMAKARGYLLSGFSCPNFYSPIFKPIAAIAGDEVIINEGGIWVNGIWLRNSKPSFKDAKGRALNPQNISKSKAPAGQVLLASSYSSRSFDGRYFGLVPATGVRAKLLPLYVIMENRNGFIANR